MHTGSWYCGILQAYMSCLRSTARLALLGAVDQLGCGQQAECHTEPERCSATYRTDRGACAESGRADADLQLAQAVMTIL